MRSLKCWGGSSLTGRALLINEHQLERDPKPFPYGDCSFLGIKDSRAGAQYNGGNGLAD